eukprot:PhM_4_TR19105/c0_g1_i2/m.28048
MTTIRLWITDSVEAVASYGFRTEDTEMDKRNKTVTIGLWLFTVLYCLTSLSWARTITFTFLLGCAIFLLLSFFVYAYTLTDKLLRRSTVVFVTLYPVILSVDFRNIPGGATGQTHGSWFIVQCVVAVVWKMSGGSRNQSLAQAIINFVLSLVIITAEGIWCPSVAEDDGSTPSTVFGGTVTSVVMPMFAFTMWVTLSMGSDYDHEARNAERTARRKANRSLSILSMHSNASVIRRTLSERSLANSRSLFQLARHEDAGDDEGEGEKPDPYVSNNSSAESPTSAASSSLRNDDPPDPFNFTATTHTSSSEGSSIKKGSGPRLGVPAAPNRRTSSTSTGSKVSTATELDAGQTSANHVMLLIEWVSSPVAAAVPVNSRDMLVRYVKVVERAIRKQHGRVLWTCGAEIYCGLESFADAVKCVQAMVALFRRDDVFHVAPVLAVTTSPITLCSVPLHSKRPVLVGFADGVRRCRDLVAFARHQGMNALSDVEPEKDAKVVGTTPGAQIAVYALPIDAADLEHALQRHGSGLTARQTSSEPILPAIASPLDGVMISFGAELPPVASPPSLSPSTQVLANPKLSPRSRSIFSEDNDTLFAPLSSPSTYLNATDRGAHRRLSISVRSDTDALDAVDLSASGSRKNDTRSMMQRRKRNSTNGEGARMCPLPDVPPHIWNLWRQSDLDGDGEIDAEEMWGLIGKLGLPLTPEKYYSVLQAVDTDGSLTISLQEFMDAYNSHVLGGLVLRANLQRAMTERTNEPTATALDLWRSVDIDGNGCLSARDAVEVIAQLGVECQEKDVAYLINEFEHEDSLLRLEDFLTLFTPVLSREEEEFCERHDAVMRVMSAIEIQRVYATPEQAEEHDAKVATTKLGNLVAPFMFIYILWIAFEVPLAAAMCSHEDFERSFLGRKIVEVCIDMLLITWVSLKFFMPRERHGRMLVQLRDIREEYIGSLEMCVDVVAAVPLDIISFGLPRSCYQELFRLNKLVMLYHLTPTFNRLTENLIPQVARITETLMWWVILINTFASIFLIAMEDVGAEETLEVIGSKDFLHSSLPTIYTQAFDWALKTMIGLSRGPPINDSDALLTVSLLTVLAGVVTYSVIVARIINALNVRDSGALFQEHLEDLSGFISYSCLPDDIAAELRGYYTHMFTSSGATTLEHDPLSDLPRELRIRVDVQLSHDILAHIPIFRGVTDDVAFMHELVLTMKPRVVLPGEWLVRRGEPATYLCCVMHGSLWRDSDRSDVPTQVLRHGDYFGGVALVHSINAAASVRCPPNKYANVYLLTKGDYASVVHYFPEVSPVVVENVRESLRWYVRHLRVGSDDIENEVDQYLACNAISASDVAAAHRTIIDRLDGGADARKIRAYCKE